MPVCYLFYRRVHTRRSQKMRGRYVHATDPQREILKRTDPRFVSNRSFPGSLARIPRQLFDINTRSPDSPSFSLVLTHIRLSTRRIIAVSRSDVHRVSLPLSLRLCETERRKFPFVSLRGVSITTYLLTFRTCGSGITFDGSPTRSQLTRFPVILPGG